MLQTFFLFFLAINPILSLPVITTTTTTPKPEELLQRNLEYERYLTEVVKALESDPEFRKKLESAHEDDIRTGNIANELDYVNHNIRTKLDELKREEVERLRKLASQQYKLANGIDEKHLKINQVAHIDHQNVHTFEIEDLKRLILKTTEDLNAADKARREDFKQYELQKEYEKQEKRQSFEDEASRAKYEAELELQQQKHNKHEKVHHPGNKEQLEEVWEKQDHMEGVEFNPETFFMMHDLDSNGVWDQNEVKALFIKELDKVYQQGLPEDDMRERAEEMERMREHVFKESDRNRDGLIDYQEFIDQTKRDEFQRDTNWDTVDNAKIYTHEEYQEYERRRHEEMQRYMAEHPEMQPHQVPRHQQQQQQQQQQQYQQPQQQQQQQQQYQQQQQQQQQYQQQQQQYQQQQQQYPNKQQGHAQHNQQEIPVQQQQPQVPVQQQKPISNSAASNQIHPNEVNSKQNSKEQPNQANHGQQPQVLQPHQ